MRKNRIEACATAESRAENNHPDFAINVLENETLHNSMKANDSIRDLGILNNQYLQLIIVKIIYEWCSNDI